MPCTIAFVNIIKTEILGKGMGDRAKEWVTRYIQFYAAYELILTECKNLIFEPKTNLSLKA